VPLCVKNTFVHYDAEELEETRNLRRSNSGPALSHPTEQDRREVSKSSRQNEIFSEAAMEMKKKGELKSSPATFHSEDAGQASTPKVFSILTAAVLESKEARGLHKTRSFGDVPTRLQSPVQEQVRWQDTNTEDDARQSTVGIHNQALVLTQPPNSTFDHMGRSPHLEICDLTGQLSAAPWQVPPPANDELPFYKRRDNSSDSAVASCTACDVVTDGSNLPSLGSFGHPVLCRAPCKYVWRRTGCREGQSCACCHLCQWSRKNNGLLGYERTQLPNADDNETGSNSNACGHNAIMTQPEPVMA